MTAGQRCAACKRRLKRPSESGLGPVCERRLHGPPARRPRPAAPAATAEPIPGQTELELPGIDWSDVGGDAEPDRPRRPSGPCRLDLYWQGLTALQLDTMTTVPTGSYL